MVLSGNLYLAPLNNPKVRRAASHRDFLSEHLLNKVENSGCWHRDRNVSIYDTRPSLQLTNQILTSLRWVMDMADEFPDTEVC